MSKRNKIDANSTLDPASGYAPAVATAFRQTTLRVGEMHKAIADQSFHILCRVPVIAVPAGLVRAVHDAISGRVYRAVGDIGAGAISAIGNLRPDHRTQVPGRLASGVRSAVNGVFGDYLAGQGNPLASEMAFYIDGQLLSLRADALMARFGNNSHRLCVFIHGLTCDEGCWQSGRVDAVDYGHSLQKDLGMTPLYIRYNSGLPIEVNGLALAGRLGDLVANWPCDVESLTIVGHSMGGLIARIAMQHAADTKQPWLGSLRTLICLGTPHRGAALERLGRLATVALNYTRITAPLGRIAQARSMGIQSLALGLRNVQQGGATPPALPGIAYRFVAANLHKHAAHPLGHVLGDGLVTLDSAMEPGMAGDVQAVRLGGLGHMGLLHDARVYAQILVWLAN